MRREFGVKEHPNCSRIVDKGLKINTRPSFRVIGLSRKGILVNWDAQMTGENDPGECKLQVRRQLNTMRTVVQAQELNALLETDSIHKMANAW